MSNENTDRPRTKYITKISKLPMLSDLEKHALAPVEEKFVFRTNDYYQSLIDWNDPADPLRRIIMPDVQELDEFGELDASAEHSYTAVNGLEHKYGDTGLLLVNDVCGAYCRFCFRKRLFTADNDEVVKDVTEGVQYIRAHSEISNVLLTGGDPLIMSTGRLEGIIRQLAAIDHVRIIRIGSKMPAFDPHRILNDPSLIEMFGRYIAPNRKIYVMAHFNHPRELTNVALSAIQMLQKAGVILVNQTPLIRGVNDNPAVIAELFNTLSFNGVPPYYLFICRPTLGNRTYIVPVEECLDIFEQASRNLSGLAKRARLCMSHRTGKLEVLAKFEGHTFFRYHRAAEPANRGRVIAFKGDPTATWFDDYIAASERTGFLGGTRSARALSNG
jgi:lysine 2,3-aminomutase